MHVCEVNRVEVTDLLVTRAYDYAAHRRLVAGPTAARVDA